MSDNNINKLIINTSEDFKVSDISLKYIYSLAKEHGRLVSNTNAVTSISDEFKKHNIPTLFIDIDEKGFAMHIKNGSFLVLSYNGKTPPSQEILEIAEVLMKVFYYEGSKITQEINEQIWSGLNERNIKYVDNQTSTLKAKKRLENIITLVKSGKIEEVSIQENGNLLLSIPHELTPKEVKLLEDAIYSAPIKRDEPLYKQIIIVNGNTSSIIEDISESD